jgi:N-acetylglucosamine malate deacetylase 1
LAKPKAVKPSTKAAPAPARKGRMTALAVGCHPDDVEFMMAGTLLMLQRAGATIHIWNVANGSCGTAVYGKSEIIRMRGDESRASARVAGAAYHRPIVDDLDVYYDGRTLARAAAVVREIKPTIILTHSPQDYMEDHQNVCRLVVSAAFTRGMINFGADGAPVWGGETCIYHSMPHGLRDGLRNVVHPGQYVDISLVLAKKREMLACHVSQKEWLDKSQGMDAYLIEMEKMSAQVGKMSEKFRYAEGWRRRSHLGYGPEGWDPMSEALEAACIVDADYEKALG